MVDNGGTFYMSRQSNRANSLILCLGLPLSLSLGKLILLSFFLGAT